jgi:TonB family protein
MIAARIAALFIAAASATGSPSSQLTLGGVTVGGSVLAVVKALGMPDNVQTTDSGHLWQWSTSGGLDREVVTDDDLNVVEVLVAHAAAQPSPSSGAALPLEIPVLGDSAADAGAAVNTLGGIAVVQTKPGYRAWMLSGGVLAARTDGGVIASMIALDVARARQRGFLTPASPDALYRAPVLLKPFVTDLLPHGSGETVVRARIDAAGTVTEALIVAPSGDPEIDAWALTCIRRSKFAAATCDGVPCAGVYFQIDGMMR